MSSSHRAIARDAQSLLVGRLGGDRPHVAANCYGEERGARKEGPYTGRSSDHNDSSQDRVALAHHRVPVREWRADGLLLHATGRAIAGSHGGCGRGRGAAAPLGCGCEKMGAPSCSTHRVPPEPSLPLFFCFQVF